jgi:hypothetical protein
MTLKSTKPPLTPEMAAADSASGTSPAGAGGWTPRQRTNILYALLAGIGAACVQLGAAPEINLRSAIIAVGAGAVAAGGTLLGLMSAGTRKVRS